MKFMRVFKKGLPVILGALMLAAPALAADLPAPPSAGPDSSAQLRKALENQEKILAELAEIKEEIRILKIRVSR